MALPPTYVNFQTPAIDAGNLNAVNLAIYQLLGNGVDAPVTRLEVRNNLGLGTMATQNANAVAVTGGTVSGLSAPLPVASGGTGLAIATPVFSAYRNSNQALPNAAATEIILNTAEFDSLGAFNTTTGRYTPTVAGYYQVNLTVSVMPTGGFSQNTQVYLYKNGVIYKVVVTLTTNSADVGAVNVSGSTLVFLNGTTDFISMAVFNTISAGTQVISGVSTATTMSGYFVRS